MPLVPLLALALLAADPAPAAAAPTPPPEEGIPVGAPSDDYGFVSWCYGALHGHMDLYKVVKPELDKLPDPDPKETKALDADEQKAGEEYLALYRRAITAAEKASAKPINALGGQAVSQGAAIWGPALQADPKTRMWSYLSWELPGRCETAAERLYEKSLLGAAALGISLDDPNPPQTPASAATTAPAPATAKPAAPVAGLRGAQ